MGAPQVSISQLDNDISFFQNVLSSLPRSHPLCPPCTQALAVARSQRYTLSGLKDDLDKSIFHYTDAIFLPLPWDSRCRNTIQLFFYLTDALIHRARRSKQPEDVTCCITYLRYLRGQPLEAYKVLLVKSHHFL
ncbi:hypothetical protein BJV78DRAFT_756192 [Lactifluus subvellereus]|nr:hypothetical protein BJV78DRAFT_756192 [Lactifluus subvellereus]